MRASIVDHSRSTMGENVQYSYMFHVLAILCAGLSQKMKLSQGSTKHE